MTEDFRLSDDRIEEILEKDGDVEVSPMEVNALAEDFYKCHRTYRYILKTILPQSDDESTGKLIDDIIENLSGDVLQKRLGANKNISGKDIFDMAWRIWHARKNCKRILGYVRDSCEPEFQSMAAEKPGQA